MARRRAWEEYLSAFAQGGPFRISGRTGDQSLNSLQSQACLNDSDVIWIPEFTTHSVEAAIHSLRGSKHVLLGFPVVDFQGTVGQMVKLAREANVDVQVGHHHRYHPAFRTILDCLSAPQFVKLKHQQKEFIRADNEQMLLQQLMYDVDTILALIKHPLKKVNAHISRINEELGRVIDIRLDFHNGSAASINFSNLGLADERTIEITDHQNLYFIDFNKGIAKSYNYENGVANESLLWPIEGGLGLNIGTVDMESLTRECVSFFKRKALNRKPLASIEEGYEALQITEIILKKIGIGLS